MKFTSDNLKRCATGILSVAQFLRAAQTIIFSVAVVFLLLWFASWKQSSVVDFLKAPAFNPDIPFVSEGKHSIPPAASDVDFLVLASPLETPNQVFSIGSHAMPPVSVMLPVSEQDRARNPSITAAQLQRARWMERTWEDAIRRGESNLSLSIKGDSFSDQVGRIFGKPLDRENSLSSIVEQSRVKVLSNEIAIPSLFSGQLPVFSDAETARWKEVAAKNFPTIGLNELDMRRAKYFQNQLGPNVVPGKQREDIERRAAEKLQNTTTPHNAAPLSDNERLELACLVLNHIFNPSARPAVTLNRKEP